jgi:lipopolysaccharide export system permease protein
VSIFDRYLLREWFQIIGLVIIALLGLLLVQVMYTDLPPLMDAGAKIPDVGMYLVVCVPSFLALLLPLTLLVSLLYTLGQMHRHHEFTALRAAGVSLGRITAPVWLIGVLGCSLTWWLNSTVVPWSIETSSALREQLRFRKESRALSVDQIGAVNDVCFDNRQDRRVWFLNRYSTYNKKAYGVTLSFLNPQRKELRRVLASEAWREPSGKGWVFANGRELVFDVDSPTPVSNRAFSTLSCPDLTEDPNLMLLIDRKPIDLSFRQLERLISHLEDTGNPKVTAYAVRFHGLLADTLAPLIVIAIAIPFAVSGIRVNPAVGISKSIGLFALYYLFAQLGGSLAAKHFLTPLEAAWLPNLGMIGLALWFFYRLR